MKITSLLPFVWLVVSCMPKSKTEGKFEALPFAVTGSAEAMPAFQKGLLLLHNFEYPDAAESFIEAQKADPSFAMAYWGEAMTYNHPVWRDQDARKAREALAKLGTSAEIRIAKGKTPIERDFLKSVEILYGPGSKPDRDKAYAAFLETVFSKNPGHHEVALFYALSLLGISEGWDKELNTRAAGIVEGILKENPKHPGALHYLIHSDDHPEYAKRALDAANDYSKVASYAGHALHMPSHIYLALGMWDDVVKANVVSWQASIDRKKAKNLTNDALNYHGYWWLEYGYLQQGRYDSARRLFENQIRFTHELSSARARVHFTYMKGHYLIETNDWKNALASVQVETKDLALGTRSLNYFIDGMQAFYQKDKQTIDRKLEQLDKEIREAEKLKQTSDGITICSVTLYTVNVPSRKDINLSNILKMELQGLSAWLGGNHNAANEWFQKAALQEDQIGYFFGPPDILKPSHELYGDFLLATNRPREASEQFDQALIRAPKRVLSLRGKMTAARMLQDPSTAKEIDTILRDILKHADEAARVQMSIAI